MFERQAKSAGKSQKISLHWRKTASPLSSEIRSHKSLLRELGSIARRALVYLFLSVSQPQAQGNLQEGLVEEGLEVLGDAGARRRLHLVDDLVGVLVQEVVHCFT